MFNITHAKNPLTSTHRQLTLLLEDSYIELESDICTCHTTPVVISLHTTICIYEYLNQITLYVMVNPYDLLD